MKTKQVKFAIRKCIKETYGKAGYTNTADKFLRLFFAELKRINKRKHG